MQDYCKMMALSLLFFLATLLCSPTEAWTHQHREKEDFEFLLLSQFWPKSSCVYFENEHKHCIVPPAVTGWTIHGLWPSIKGTEKPNYCNDSMKFDYSQIKSLSPRLAVNWPSFEKEAPPTELWQHEWVKHGTCAYSLPILQGELRYFGQTLDLHDKLNITRYLSNSGIVPSETEFHSREDIFNAVQKSTGTIPNINCIREKKTGQFHVQQVWLCYSKQLEPIDCPDVAVTRRLSSTLYFESGREQGSPNSDYEDCPSGEPLYYKPIPRS